jgi:hypothetical protein
MKVRHISFGTLLVLSGVLAATAVAQDGGEAPTGSSNIQPSAPLSTHSLFPQIDDRFVLQPLRPENPLPIIPGDGGASIQNTLPVGGLTDVQNIGGMQKFPGIGATGWSPPDPTLGVGPNHVVITVNSSLAFFDKNTGASQFQQTFETFFNGVHQSTFIFDPKVFYDRIHNRWFVIVLEKSDSPRRSALLVAISDDNNPHGTWYRYRIDVRETINSVDSWFDYPAWGYNKDAVVTSGNMFGWTSGYQAMKIVAFNKAQMMNNQTVNFWWWTRTNLGHSAQFAESANWSVARVYGANLANTSGQLRMLSIGGIPSGPVLHNFVMTVPSWVEPSVNAPSPSGRTLDALGGRVMNAALRGTNFVTTHTVAASGDNRNRVRWYMVNMSSWPTSGTPVLLQSGNILGGTGQHHFMGAVTMNKYNDMAAVFTRSSSSIVADIMATARRSTDAAGTMGALRLLESSAGSTYGSSGFNRWGDYSMVTVDPSDEAAFWCVHMSGTSTGAWRTSFFKFWMSVYMQSMALREETRIGGLLTVATPRLVGPAPPGGASVSLVSTVTSAATIPSSVLIPAGATSANVNVTTLGVDNNTYTQIRGTYNSTTASRWLLVTPAALIAVGVSPSNPIGGTNSTVTLYLNGKTGPSGGTVSLSSNHPALIVPSTTTIPAQASTHAFTVGTKGVGVDTTVTLTASYRGVNLTRNLIVRPANLKSVVPEQSQVKGGTQTNIRVHLDGQSPEVNTAFSLSSNTAAATPPSTSWFITNTTNRRVAVNTKVVATNTVATITATYRGISKAGSFVITP